MTEHPIIFNGEMVKAILDGRKTQTRRVIKPRTIKFPYGMPGDKLWVRETFGLMWPKGCDNGMIYEEGGNPEGRAITSEECDLKYRATEPDCIWADEGQEGAANRDESDGTCTMWKPSIHMPRWAARIFLEVVYIGVKRIKYITEEDSKAEGAIYHNGMEVGHSGFRFNQDHEFVYKTAKEAFAVFWDSINLKRGFGWEANPYCWVVEFKRIEP